MSRGAGMNDERSMILKMLSEGKISVEEADALLDVVNGSAEDEEPAGFASTTASASGGTDSGSSRDENRGASGAVHDDSHKGHKGHEKGKKGFSFDIDLSGLTESLRETMGSVHETMKGVGATIREAFEGFEGFDIGEEISRAMGRHRTEAERRLNVPTDGATSLTIANKWGDLRVTGADTDEVSVLAKVAAWAEDVEKAETIIADIDVELNRDGDHLILESRSGVRQGVRIDYEITVPRSLDVTVSTASGDLWLEDLAGSQTANTLSGDISVASLGSGTSDIQVVQTKSGDVLAAALSGNITLSTLSGDVTIDGFEGTLEVSSQSGDISVKSGRGTLRLKSMSGSISAETEEIGEGVSLTTVSGDIDLSLPRSAAFDFAARTESGDISIGCELEDEERSKRRTAGRCNGGGVAVSATSVSGDISVEPSAE